MPKKINSVLLNKSSVNLISDFCKRNDISEAAFSRKFGKNNRWISDLRRCKNLSLPDAEEAARMCILLETTPEEILLQEGETDEETAKCLEDIQRVKELVAELRKEEAPDPKIEGISAERKALLDIVYSLTDEQCRKLLGVVLEAKKLM
jgi:hypothetical protein|nr:MAG TPA_asm: helix-turn-helix domain protein [Caudoviricetes sp.]